MSICDHYTRVKMQEPEMGREPCVYGMLFGVQTGLKVEVFNSMELVVTRDGGRPRVDKAFLTERLDLLKKVFETYELLGWYATEADVQPWDLDLHEDIASFNESPLFLRLNPALVADMKELPMYVYEAEWDADAGERVFVGTAFRIDSVESERITVDAISDTRAEKGNESSSTSRGQERGRTGVGVGGNRGSTTVAMCVAPSCAVQHHYTQLETALRRVSERIGVLSAYLEGVRSGRFRPDPAILREVAGVITRLPAADSKEFERAFLTEMNDTLLTTLVAEVAKGTAGLVDVADRVRIMTEDARRRTMMSDPHASLMMGMFGGDALGDDA